MTILSYSYSENYNLFKLFLSRKEHYTGTSEVNGTSEDTIVPGDKEMTKLCMKVSELSLAKEWEDEDDEYWKSYLK